MNTDSTPTATPAGWYPDPGAPEARLRYWDGTTWTSHTHDPATEVPTAPPPGRRPLEPGFSRLGRAVQGLLGLCALALLASAVLHAVEAVTIRGWLQDPASADVAQGRLLDHLVRVAGIAWLLGLIATGTTYLFWFHRAYTSDRVDAQRLHNSPSWTVWSWFVPVVCWFKPCQLTTELWHASLRQETEPGAGGRQPAPVRIRVWWTLWIAASAANLASRLAATGAADSSNLVTRQAWAAAPGVALAGSAVVLVGIVGAITSRLAAPVPPAQP